MGADSFRAAFGSKQGKNALGRCVSAQRKARKDARKRARKACRAKGLRGQAMKRCFRHELAARPGAQARRLRGRGRRSASPTRPRTPRTSPPSTATARTGFAKCVAHEVERRRRGRRADESEPGDDGDVRGLRGLATTPSRTSSSASLEQPAVAPREPAREVGVRLLLQALHALTVVRAARGSRCGRSRCACGSRSGPAATRPARSEARSCRRRANTPASLWPTCSIPNEV